MTESARPSTTGSATQPDIELRPFLSTDLPFFASLARDARVTRHVGDGQPWTPEQIDERTRAALRQDAVEGTGAARWFIAEEAGRAVGLFTMTRRERSIEVGYWVAPEHWARGVAGVMLDLGTAAAPDHFGVDCLSARVSEANIASARALTRRGFELLSRRDGLNMYSRGQEGRAGDGPRSRENRGFCMGASVP